MVDSLNRKYEDWKNRLLDLGKRNRLLNYKNSARSTVKITNPECMNLYKSFAQKEKVIIFPYPCDEEEKIESNVETDKEPVDLQKVLKNLRKNAKTVIEEQGVNTLYLSFGFLKWTEAARRGQEFYAPLILVPVILKVDSLTSPYKLVLHDEEAVLNPTLCYKLENEYNIALPAFNDESDVNEYFNKLKELSFPDGWDISYDVSLGLLSFQKIDMYRDLKEHREIILSNPIVRAIGGDLSAVQEIPSTIDECDLDTIENLSDIFQVVDADASQQKAILMAKRGVSFVLQGPPGTGKSQTITNIIAERLAVGKKVLFVSEKIAALDVVYSRLESAGLDTFCLVLHNNKASKRDVMEQLKTVLNKSTETLWDFDEYSSFFDDLQATRKSLNDYSEQVYKKIEPLGKSIYEVNGIIADLEEYPELIFSIDNIREISNQKYAEITHLVNQLVLTLGKKSDDFNLNPWKGCCLPFVSNEFRHDFYVYVDALLPKLGQAEESLRGVLDKLYLDLPLTLDNMRKLSVMLTCTENATTIPIEWVYKTDIDELIEAAHNLNELKNAIESAICNLTVKYEKLQAMGVNDLNLDISNITDLDSACDAAKMIENYISQKKPYSFLSKIEISSLLSRAEKISETINLLKSEVLSIYEPTVFDLNYKAILNRIKVEYTSFVKVFNKEYRQDKKAISSHRKDFEKKISDEEMLELVEKLSKIDKYKQWYADDAKDLSDCFGVDIDENTDYQLLHDQIEIYRELVSIYHAMVMDKGLVSLFSQENKSSSAFKNKYSFCYDNGIFTNWELIIKSLKWAELFRCEIREIDVTSEFVKNVCEGGSFLELCKISNVQILEFISSIENEYNWLISNFENSTIFENLTLFKLSERLNNCKNNFFLLEEWIDFRTIRADCIKVGLKSFVEAVENSQMPTNEIVSAFNKRFFRLWLDSVLPECPAILNFRRSILENKKDNFVKYDKFQFVVAKERIYRRLIDKVPSGYTSGNIELNILKRELSKQKRIMPIRSLFKQIPNLLLTLKPCLMMSPLSVSKFLESDAYKFDTVIFDEASQVLTENAIGAIARGKQVIIAGDSRQLPPTNFFKSASFENDFGDSDEDSFDDIGVYESVLDEANMLPEITLKWHYRSRHESLIAFSNKKIYDNAMITYPSNIAKTSDIGVEYIMVPNGCYDRGGTKCNLIEAQKVAELVFEHIKKYGDSRSLGVIAFGEPQQQAIEDVIQKYRFQQQNPAVELFFSEEKENMFFVKNLENVQGDERDTIILSIGYAKDSTDNMKNYFGPLGQPGGERRLNVAITRAKYNLKLVGSILPGDINIDSIKSEGPKLLRTYIDFAINGQSVIENVDIAQVTREQEFLFEQNICNILERNGYRFERRVGCSEYKIDIAVKHPKKDNVYVLGIECDGRSYHSAKTARERDRLRTEVLNNMGWMMYHIWSAEWVKDPITQEKRLVEAIEMAITNFDN